jgi:hypothetical protein
MRLRRETGTVTVTVRSADRAASLKAPKLH